MSRNRPRWLRILRVGLRRRLARLDRTAPAWLSWLPFWGTSLLIHALILVLVATFLYTTSRPSERTELESSIIAYGDGGPEALEPLDPAGDSMADPTTTPSLAALPTPSLDLNPTPSLADLPKSDPEPEAFAPPSIPNLGGRASAFSGRGANRAELVRREGGTSESERAVDQGLHWLSRHQRKDGSWRLDVHQECRQPDGCPGGGGGGSETAATGFALLSFLGAGHTHNKPGPYRELVGRALNWLVEHQQKSGALVPNITDSTTMYSHGIAAMALCEAYGITRDSRLRGPARLAIDFITHSQNKQDGGWRYTPNQRGDTSVFVWQMLALRSASLAGIEVSKNVIRGCQLYIDRASADKDQTTYAYVPGGGPGRIMTAAGLLCRQYLGWSRNHPPLIKGVAGVWADLQASPGRNIYHWYYATQLLHNMQNDAWKKWNPIVRDNLVATQVVSKGCDHGSWSPTSPQPDPYGASHGRLFQTALSILTLEVYYRYLPIYRSSDRAVVEK